MRGGRRPLRSRRFIPGGTVSRKALVVVVAVGALAAAACSSSAKSATSNVSTSRPATKTTDVPDRAVHASGLHAEGEHARRCDARRRFDHRLRPHLVRRHEDSFPLVPAPGRCGYEVADVAQRAGLGSARRHEHRGFRVRALRRSEHSHAADRGLQRAHVGPAWLRAVGRNDRVRQPAVRRARRTATDRLGGGPTRRAARRQERPAHGHGGRGRTAAAFNW